MYIQPASKSSNICFLTLESIIIEASYTTDIYCSCLLHRGGAFHPLSGFVSEAGMGANAIFSLKAGL